MTYVDNKPDAGVSPFLDVSIIQGNFATFDSVFAANHTPLNDPSQGKHEAIIFEQTPDDPEVIAGSNFLYSQQIENNIGTEPQLLIRVPKFLPDQFNTRNAPNNPMQLTYSQVNTAGPVYQSFLIGGYVIYFGQTSNITNVINLAPAPSAILSAIASPHNMTSGSTTSVPYNASVTILSNSSFRINSTLNGSGSVVSYLFTYVVIAKQ